MFYDSDDESNLSSLFTFGILQEDYNIPVPGDENGTTKLTDLKGIAPPEYLKKPLTVKIVALFPPEISTHTTYQLN